MNAVVLGGIGSTIMNSAAGNNCNISTLADVKVVAHHFLIAAFAQKNRNMNTFILSIWFNHNIDAAILPGFNINIGRSITRSFLSIHADVISTLRHLVKFCNLRQQILLNAIHT